MERLRQEDLNLNRNRNQGSQSETSFRLGTLASGSLSRPSRRLRLEYLVPTTRNILTTGSGLDDEHPTTSSTGRVRLPTPLSRRDPDAVQTQLSSAWGEQDGTNGNGGHQEAGPGLVYGAATPYYVNPLPMPLEEMLSRPMARKPVGKGKGKVGQKGESQRVGVVISGKSDFAAR